MIFLFESILIIIGINLGMISYGTDVQTPFMAIGVLIGLVIGSVVRLFLNSFNTKPKKNNRFNSFTNYVISLLLLSTRGEI